jgi:voltage-gated potassium channel
MILRSLYIIFLSNLLVVIVHSFSLNVHRKSILRNERDIFTRLALQTEEQKTGSDMFYAKVSKKRNSEGKHDVHEDKSKSSTIVDGIAGQELSDDKLVLPYTHELQELISSPQLEIFDAFLVLLSSFAVALSTLPADSFPTSSFVLLEYLENALGIYFFSAFFVRWYCVGQFGFSYLLRPLSFIDVFASVLPVILSSGDLILGVGYIPAVLSSPSALANLRLLRVLRLQALLVDMKTFSKVQIAFGLEPGDVKKYQLTLARVIITILCLVSVATGCIYAAEHEVNPQIPDYFTALYFGLTTLTTVGFGDITPITTEGRFVVIASILVGVVVIPVSVTSNLLIHNGTDSDDRFVSLS